MSNRVLVDVSAVVRRVVADDATAMADVGAVEDLLTARDLRALRVRVTGPGVEEIEAAFNLRHGRQRLWAAARAVRVQTPDARHCELRSQQRALRNQRCLSTTSGVGWRALQRARHEAVGLVDQPGALAVADVGAGVPVDRRAADGEVDGRHRAPPVNEPVEVREPVRIVNGDQFPLGVRPGSAAPAEDAAAQEHAVGGAARLHRGDIHVRVVGVERVEDRVSAVRFVEQALQRAGGDAPGLLRDMARGATLAVRALSTGSTRL